MEKCPHGNIHGWCRLCDKFAETGENAKRSKRRYAFFDGHKVLIVKGPDGEDDMMGEHVGSCSGCYESEDGHPVGVYPIHPTYGCAMGSGCSECGGHGIRREKFWVPLPSCARIPSAEKGR